MTQLPGSVKNLNRSSRSFCSSLEICQTLPLMSNKNCCFFYYTCAGLISLSFSLSLKK